MLCKTNEVELFLEKNDIGIFCITEHWLQENQITMFNMPHYMIVSCYNRITFRHGGSLILVWDNIKSKNRQDIVRLSVERQVELSCVELDKYIIVCVYRPPSGDYNIFERVMEDVLSMLSNSTKDVIVSGDFNIDLLVDSSLSNQLRVLFKSFDLINVFMEPTRITATTATCLDNIFCNCMYSDEKIINHITSDHCGQIITLKNDTKSNKPSFICRPVTLNKIHKLKVILEEELPKLHTNRLDINNEYNNLFTVINKAFDKIFTLKKSL